MGKFKLELNLGFDAMQDSTGVVDALGKVMGRVAAGDMGGTVLDVNGNSVGSWELRLPDPDFAAMTDAELATALHKFDNDGNEELLLFAENEVCDRLDLSPDETEQGLTAAAQDAVQKFVDDNRMGGG